MKAHYDRERIIWDSSYGPLEKLLLLALNSFVDGNGDCWPGLDRLKLMSGMSRRTVIRKINELEADGALRITRRKSANGTQQSSIYRVDFEQIKSRVSLWHPEQSRVSLTTEPGVTDDTSRVSLTTEPGVTLTPDLSNDLLNDLTNELSLKRNEIESGQKSEEREEKLSGVEGLALARNSGNPPPPSSVQPPPAVVSFEQQFRRRTAESAGNLPSYKAAHNKFHPDLVEAVHRSNRAIWGLELSPDRPNIPKIVAYLRNLERQDDTMKIDAYWDSRPKAPSALQESPVPEVSLTDEQVDAFLVQAWLNSKSERTPPPRAIEALKRHYAKEGKTYAL